MSNTIQNTSGVLPGFETTPAPKAEAAQSSGLFTEYLEAEMLEPVPAAEAAQQEAAAQENAAQENAAQDEAQQDAAQQSAAPAVPDNPMYYNFLGGPVRVEGTTEYYDYNVTSFIEDTSGGDSGGFMTVCSGGVCRQVPIGGNYSTTPGSIFAPVGGAMPFLAAAPAQSASAAPATPSTAPVVTAAAEKAALEASLMTEAVNAIVEEIIGGDDEERKDLLV